MSGLGNPIIDGWSMATDWLSAHSTDLWVNVVGALPFLAFEVVILAVALPTAITWLNLAQTRSTRLTAISEVLRVLTKHLDDVSVAAHQGRSAYERAEQNDFGFRLEFQGAIGTAKTQFSDELPIALSVIGNDAAGIVIEINAVFRQLMEALTYATGKVHESIYTSPIANLELELFNHELKRAGELADQLYTRVHALETLGRRVFRASKHFGQSNPKRNFNVHFGLRPEAATYGDYVTRQTIGLLISAMKICSERSTKVPVDLDTIGEDLRNLVQRHTSYQEPMERTANDDAGENLASDDSLDHQRMHRIVRYVLPDGTRAWALLSISSPLYDTFKSSWKSGRVDLNCLDDFGEVVVAAAGEGPSEQALVSAATVLGVDRADLLPLD